MRTIIALSLLLISCGTAGTVSQPEQSCNLTVIPVDCKRPIITPTATITVTPTVEETAIEGPNKHESIME